MSWLPLLSTLTQCRIELMNRVVPNQEDQVISLLPDLAIPVHSTIAVSSLALALALPARQNWPDSAALDSVSTTPSWIRFEWSPLGFLRKTANDSSLLLSIKEQPRNRTSM
jgi:hypothetical protein